MHTRLYTSLILLLGIVIGAIITVPALLFFLRTDVGTTLLRMYVVTTPQWPDVDPSASGIVVTPPAVTGTGTTTAQGQTASTTGLSVPKAYTNQAYDVAINALVSDVGDFGKSYTQLVPVLTTINAKSLRGDYSNFFDLIVQAKAYIASEKMTVAQIGQHLTDLNVANQTTSDTVTKSLTQDLLLKGATFHDSLQIYMTMMDNLLSGSIPSAQQISDVNTQAAKVNTDTVAFNAALQAIVVHFKEKIDASKP